MYKLLKKWRDAGYELNYGSLVIQDFIQKNVTIFDNPKILDVGSGYGRDLHLIDRLLKSKSAELHGIGSIDVEGVAIKDVDLECSHLPYMASSFDIVICNQVLEHLKNWIWALHELMRVTKIGGHMIIGVPNLAALHCRLQLMFGRQPSCIYSDDAHVRGFTAHEILKVISKINGLEVVSFRGSNMYGLPPAFAQLLARLFPKYAVSIFFLLKKNNEFDVINLIKSKQLETNYFVGL